MVPIRINCSADGGITGFYNSLRVSFHSDDYKYQLALARVQLEALPYTTRHERAALTLASVDGVSIIYAEYSKWHETKLFDSRLNGFQLEVFRLETDRDQSYARSIRELQIETFERIILCKDHAYGLRPPYRRRVLFQLRRQVHLLITREVTLASASSKIQRILAFASRASDEIAQA